MTVPLSAALPLLLLAMTLASDKALQGIFGPVQEAIKAELALSDFRMGLLQGLATSIPLALLSIPLGRLVDRGNRVRLMIVMAAISSAGTLLTAFASSFAWMFVARMAAGLGATCAIPAAISIAADLCRPERRGRAVLVLTIGFWTGAGAAFAIGGGLYGVLAHGGGRWASLGMAPWRAVHLIAGIGSLALILPLLALREPPRHELGAGQHAPFRVVLRELIDRRNFLAPLFVGQIGVVVADTAAGVWASPVLIRNYHLTPGQFGGWMGLVVFASGLIGSIAGGLIADAGQRSDRRGGILVGAVAASVFSIPAAFFSVMPSALGFAALLAVLLLCGTMAGLITSAAIAVIIPNELRGVCLGAFVAVAGVIGFGFAPTLVSVLAGALGGPLHLGAGLAIVGAGVG